MDGAEIKHVRVINRNAMTISDRFDNKQYDFPPNQEVILPLDAAGHIFGFTPTATEEQCMLHCLKRFGYNRPEIMAARQHELFWENLEIRPAFYKLVEVSPAKAAAAVAPPAPMQSDAVEQQPRRGRGRPRKSYSRTHKRVLRPPVDVPGEPVVVAEPTAPTT
jgi:hypothetical protein